MDKTYTNVKYVIIVKNMICDTLETLTLKLYIFLESNGHVLMA